jgi:hypothetical protein
MVYRFVPMVRVLRLFTVESNWVEILEGVVPVAGGAGLGGRHA